MVKGQSMLKDQTTQTDTYLHGLTAEEEAALKHQIRTDQEKITQEYEDNIRISEEKSARFEALYNSSARELSQITKEHDRLKEERASIDATILEKDELIRSETTQKIELQKKIKQLQSSMLLQGSGESQEDLLNKIDRLQKQIEEVKQINRDITISLSKDIQDLSLHLRQNTEAYQQLEQTNLRLRQQLDDLRDQQLKDESPTPSTPGVHASLATELSSAGILGQLRGPLQEIVLEDNPVLINELFIERQKYKLMALALAVHSSHREYRLKGGWVNQDNRNRLIVLLDHLKWCKDDLQGMAVASFMKVIHDVEATIQYAHVHQQAYASSAFHWDATLFFSHNQEGIKNSIKVIEFWERDLKRILNQQLTHILGNFNDERGHFARLGHEHVGDFRAFCNYKVNHSIKYCILTETVSDYKSHSFRAYLHHLKISTTLRDSALDMPTIEEINVAVTQRNLTMSMMLAEEDKLMHHPLELTSLESP